MQKHEILEILKNAVIEGDDDRARAAARQALQADMDPLEAMQMGLSRGTDVIGERFERGEAYLPELIMAGETFKAAMEILDPEIKRQQRDVATVGTVVMTTVKGDLHSIGKNIVSTVLETNGFNVVDMGVDKGALQIIEAAQKANADAIGLSALMSTTMPAQKEVIDALRELKLRDRYHVVVGGGPVTQEWADEIGADGYAEDAVQAVELLERLLKS
ncbi:MAG: cobalamin-dependent protein [Anaerolineae bacterium]|jgi:corrinoid protein of di/trimethylamine methyltransferase